MEYRWQFNKPTLLTRIDEKGKVVGDYEAEQGQRYRVIAHSISHVSVPGVELALVALPEEGFVTEQMFIVPAAALKSSQSLKARA
jgi:hypothetical protein